MTALRHTFKSRKPLARLDEEVKFYGNEYGSRYHNSMPIQQTPISACRQSERFWTSALLDSLPSFMGGLATAYKDIFETWYNEAKRLEKSKQAAHEVYERNEPFWLALRKLALQLDAKDMIMTRSDVLVWAVKDTVRERVEDVEDAAEFIKETGKSAVNAVEGAASAIPTIAKAFAIGAIGLGVYAVARRS